MIKEKNRLAYVLIHLLSKLVREGIEIHLNFNHFISILNK